MGPGGFRQPDSQQSRSTSTCGSHCDIHQDRLWIHERVDVAAEDVRRWRNHVGCLPQAASGTAQLRHSHPRYASLFLHRSLKLGFAASKNIPSPVRSLGCRCCRPSQICLWGFKSLRRGGSAKAHFSNISRPRRRVIITKNLSHTRLILHTIYLATVSLSCETQKWIHRTMKSARTS